MRKSFPDRDARTNSHWQPVTIALSQTASYWKDVIAPVAVLPYLRAVPEDTHRDTPCIDEPIYTSYHLYNTYIIHTRNLCTLTPIFLYTPIHPLDPHHLARSDMDMQVPCPPHSIVDCLPA